MPTSSRAGLKAFTLIELIVVILVLGILAAVAVVGYTQVTNHAHDARAIANVRQFQTAIMADATLNQVPALSRDVLVEALREHFPGGVAAGTTASTGWGLLRVDDASPDVSTFAAGFDHGADTVASDAPGSRAAVVLHSNSGRSVAAIVAWDHTGDEPELCSGYVADGVTPRMVLAGRTDTGECIDPALLAPPTPTGLHIEHTAAGNVLTWDSSAVRPAANTDGALEVSRDGTWVATLPAGTTTWTDPAGDEGDAYEVAQRPATAPVASTGTVQIAWPNDPRPVNIYRDGQKVASGVSAAPFVDTAATQGAKYVVVPVSGGQEQGALPATASAAASPAPPAPGGADGGAPTLTVSGTTFSLVWDPVPSTPQAPLTGYRLYRQPQGGTTWDASSLLWSGTSTSASDSPGAGETWCYRVSAYGPGGESGLSGAACGTMDTFGTLSATTRTIDFTPDAYPAAGWMSQAVDIDGDVMAVGAPSSGYAGRGRAIMYNRVDGRWVQTQIIDRPATPATTFGRSIAVSGNTLVVGGQDVSNPALYVYTRPSAGGTWALQQTITSTNDSSFALHVAVAGDTLVTSSAGGSTSLTVYTRTAGVWTKQTSLAVKRLSAVAAANAVLLADPDTLYAGSEAGQGGAVSIFRRSGTTWTEVQKLTGASHFGDALALDGNNLAVLTGSLNATDPGAATIYTGTPGAYTLQATLTSNIGVGRGVGNGPSTTTRAALALSGDRLVVGAPGYDSATVQDSGAVLEYKRTGTTWGAPNLRVNPDGVSTQFGWSLKFDGDGYLVGDIGHLQLVR